MFCPNCNQHYDSGKFCPECGATLVDDAPVSSGTAFGVGDYAAIEGGIHLSDSHNVHHEDRSVHNITNTNSTVNNITQVAAQKTDSELLQERKTTYLNACKRAYEDNVLEQHEVLELEELRIKLNLDKTIADAILDSVRHMSERGARKTDLSPIAKIKLKALTNNLKKNEIKALIDQIDSLEPLVRKFDHDELLRKYFLVLASLKSEKCIELYETSKIDNYWKSFWSYLAYIKQGQLSKAEDVLVLLDRFSGYPEDNISVLAVAGALMMGNMVDAKEYLNEIIGEYTPALQRFVDSIYLLLEPDVAKEMGADELSCAFYLVNFFGQIDPKEKLSGLQRWGEDAQNGNPEAQYRLGMCYYKGEKEKKDVRLAFEWFMKAAEQGHAEAQLQLSDCYSDGLGVEVDESQAIEWCRKSAEQGLAAAQFVLGGLYCYGYGDLDEDEAQTIEWLTKAAKQGHVEAQWRLGDCYSDFSEFEDENQAFEWYQKAAEQGCAHAIYKLGVCYKNGAGVDMDHDYALKLFEESAEKGDIHALEMLAAIYDGRSNISIEKDIEKVADYILKISQFANEEEIYEEFDSDYYESSLYCGERLMSLKERSVKAIDLLEVVANVDNSSEDDDLEEYKEKAKKLIEAELLYSKGRECVAYDFFSSDEDTAKAVKFYKQAAKLGHSKAQFELGKCYERGDGIEADMETAVLWYNKAEKQGNLRAMNKLMHLYSKVSDTQRDADGWLEDIPNPYFDLSKANDMAWEIIDHADAKTICEIIDSDWFYSAYVLGKQLWDSGAAGVGDCLFHKRFAINLLRKVANIDEEQPSSLNNEAREKALEFLESHGYDLEDMFC